MYNVKARFRSNVNSSEFNGHGTRGALEATWYYIFLSLSGLVFPTSDVELTKNSTEYQ